MRLKAKRHTHCRQGWPGRSQGHPTPASLAADRTAGWSRQESVSGCLQKYLTRRTEIINLLYIYTYRVTNIHFYKYRVFCHCSFTMTKMEIRPGLCCIVYILKYCQQTRPNHNNFLYHYYYFSCIPCLYLIADSKEMTGNEGRAR